MDHSRNRGPGAGADIGCGARDGPRGGQAAHQRRNKIGHALRNQLHVGFVLLAVAEHTVGDHGRHQRLNRAQHGHGNRGRNQRPDEVQAELRHLQRGQAGRNPAKARADGLNRQMEYPDQRRANQERNNIAGNFWHILAEYQDQRQRQHRQTCFFERDRAEVAGHGFQAAEKIARHVVDLQSKKILELRAGDHHGDSVGESHHHRPGNVFDRAAQSGGAQKNQEDAGDAGAHEEAVNPVPGDDAGNHHDKRARRAANLHPRSAQRGDQEPGNHRAVESGLRRHSGSDGERHGQRQGNQPNGHARDQVRDEILSRITLQGQNGFWEPLCAHGLCGG